jgi:hypothetical protein
MRIRNRSPSPGVVGCSNSLVAPRGRRRLPDHWASSRCSHETPPLSVPSLHRLRPGRCDACVTTTARHRSQEGHDPAGPPGKRSQLPLRLGGQQGAARHLEAVFESRYRAQPGWGSELGRGGAPGGDCGRPGKVRRPVVVCRALDRRSQGELGPGWPSLRWLLAPRTRGLGRGQFSAPGPRVVSDHYQRDDPNGRGAHQARGRAHHSQP